MFDYFNELLAQKETLVSDFDASELFDELTTIFEENDKLLQNLDETYIWEKVAEMLTIMPANSLLELNPAKIIYLIKYEGEDFKKICFDFTHYLITGFDYYDVNMENIEQYTSLGIYTGEIYEDRITKKLREDEEAEGKLEHYLEIVEEEI